MGTLLPVDRPVIRLELFVAGAERVLGMPVAERSTADVDEAVDFLTEALIRAGQGRKVDEARTIVFAITLEG